eukprot:4551364-Pleurochrysis_carterae.AAC.1
MQGHQCASMQGHQCASMQSITARSIGLRTGTAVLPRHTHRPAFLQKHKSASNLEVREHE